MRIPLSKPFINEDVRRRVAEVLDSGYLTEGPVTQEFEQTCAGFIGCRHALAVCNCTVGLEMALRVLEVGPGDEVVVPDYTYPATASVVNIVGATVVLVDVDRATTLIDMDALEAAITPQTKVVMPVSLLGAPLDYDRLNALKETYGFFIVEDAACAMGTEFGGKKAGNLADISAFSFYPRKFITTGEGGLVTTPDDAWAEWMDSYKHFGMGRQTTREDTVFDIVGTNYKMSNILAAVGQAQMLMIDELLFRRREQAAHYVERLAGHPRIIIPAIPEQGLHSYQAFCILIEERDRVMREMRAAGVEVQIGSYALHRHSAFRPHAGCRHSGSLEDSDYVFEHALTLPLYHELTEEQQDQVIEMLCRLT